MTPTEAALRAILLAWGEWNAADGMASQDWPPLQQAIFDAEATLAAPPHGKGAGEDADIIEHAREAYYAGPPDLRIAELIGLASRRSAQRDAALKRAEELEAAVIKLGIANTEPQALHIERLIKARAQRDALQARLTEAEGLLREYLRPGRNSPEDLDGDTRAFLKKPPEGSK